MNICYVGHYQGSRDEGVRLMAKEIFKLFNESSHNVIAVDIHGWVKALRAINKFNPTVIHFVLNPTIPGLLIVRIFSSLFRNSKIIVSCIQPAIRDHWLLKSQNIDLALVQDDPTQLLLSKNSIKTRFFYNFIDMKKFSPVLKEKKIALRMKYGIPQDAFLLLHLGSLTQGRSISQLAEIKELVNCDVLIIGRENEPIDSKIYNRLVESGCLVWISHFDNINDIYNMVDCYVFPTWDADACISTPLSVLEAMACNIPIISRRFGALPSIFNEGNGFYYYDSIDDATVILDKIMSATEKVATRTMVEEFSKIKAYDTLNDIYRTVSI